MKIALFYGSTTGNTEEIAEQIQRIFGSERVALFDVAEEPLSHADNYQQIIMGIPTWDYGEVQSEWEDVWDELDQLDLSGKQVALFGLGDQIGYGEWFLDAMGLLHEKVVARGAQPVGYWPVQGYEFTASKALTPAGDQFVGLGVDEDSQHELTEERVQGWCQQLQREFGDS